MKNIFQKITLVCFLVFTTNISISQTKDNSNEPSPTSIIKMKNGDEYTGQIINQNDTTVTLKITNGEIQLNAMNVKSIQKNNYTGKFRFANPHATRYFFAPSGVPIQKGEGYYQNLLVTTNFLNYGVTKNVSIGGGFEFLSTVFGSPILFLNPKAGFKISEKIHAGGGFIMAGSPGKGNATLAYGVFTFGSLESNLSLGAGYVIQSSNSAISISGTHRISNSISLLTENYILPDESDIGYFGIHGIRILSRKNAFDIGAVIIPEIVSDVPALPYVGYVRVF